MTVKNNFIIARYLSKVEKALGMRVTSWEKYHNKYGAPKDLYRINCDSQEFFLKAYSNYYGSEYSGYLEFKDYLPTPELRARFDDGGFEVLIFDYYPSEMLCDMVVTAEHNQSDFGQILAIESQKNIAVKQKYLVTGATITFEDFLKVPLNRLFMDKLFGEVFERYYGHDKVIYPLLSSKVTLNNYPFDHSGIEILEAIKSKLLSIDPKTTADCVMGHGDLHHMNVLWSPLAGMKAIDFEYHSTVPIAMELSKPYYIDYVGTLFFFFQQQLASHFQFDKVEQSPGKIDLLIKKIKPFTGRISLTQDKVRQFAEMIDKSSDFLTFNEYLVLCHTLSHNPNDYIPEAQLLFTALIPILMEFDYHHPETLFDKF